MLQSINEGGNLAAHRRVCGPKRRFARRSAHQSRAIVAPRGQTRFRSEAAVGDGWHSNRPANGRPFLTFDRSAEVHYLLYRVKPTARGLVAGKCHFPCTETPPLRLPRPCIRSRVRPHRPAVAPAHASSVWHSARFSIWHSGDPVVDSRRPTRPRARISAGKK